MFFSLYSRILLCVMHNKTEPNEHKRQSLIKTAKYCSGGGEAELQEEENLEED